MNVESKHRVLFCIGVSQNFMDSTQDVMGDVWVAFQATIKGISDLPGVNVLGVLDDDRIQVGPSASAPWYQPVIVKQDKLGTDVGAAELRFTTAKRRRLN